MTTTLNGVDTHAQVREYYGETLQTNGDLKTQACCTADAMPDYLKPILREIDEEITTKFYGCGSPIPYSLDGCTVLDLGCGTGRDVYLASKLVGPMGRVIGVDMTEQQLEVARRHVDPQTARFGLPAPNVEFYRGHIEHLGEIGIADNSVDVVISNCVINLAPNKRQVFAEILRVLKGGGELCFSDVFSGRRVPESLVHDPVMRGECLGGAMYIEDFRRMLAELGVLDFRVMDSRRVALDDPEVEARAGMIDFYSKTVRLFKLDALEDLCEDYGQVVVYKGTMPYAPHAFALDDHHTFVSGKPMLVCGNTASMLQETRYARHFTVTGDRSTHYGAFHCDPAATTGSSGGACC